MQGLILCIVLSLVGGLPALSQTPPVSFAPIAKKVKPAVVNIATTKEIRSRTMDPWRNLDPFFKDYFERFFQAPGEEPPRQHHSLGTGFIINSKGDILTNNHVIQEADEIVVKLDDGRALQARVIGRDERLDIAVLRPVEQGTFPYVDLGDSQALEVGDWVVAVGNPFGLGHTVTAGIVSAKARVLGAGPYDDFIQTDASINPGNSGGPLFNVEGEVVGINTAIIASGQGIGFAIPINLAKEVIPQLVTKGKVSRGWLGVALKDMTEEEAKGHGLARLTGASIAEVIPGGPADRAGIKAGDVIVSFNGQEVDNAHKLPSLVAKVGPGSEVAVEFIQKGKRYSRNIRLSSLDDPGASMVPADTPQEKGILGMSVRDLTPLEKQRMGSGVIVTNIQQRSTADSIGIEVEDLILEINGESIRGTNDFKETLNKVKSGEVVRMGIARGPHRYYFAFRKE